MNEQKLRCWPGAIVEVVGGEVLENIGRRLLVIKRATQDEEWATEFGAPSWIVKPLQPVFLANHWGRSIVDNCIEGIAPDKWLRPIEPLAEEETTAERAEA